MTVKRYWTGESMAEPPAAGEPVKSARDVPQFTPVKELSVPLSAARTVRVLPTGRLSLAIAGTLNVPICNTSRCGELVSVSRR